jgi:copper transporter 1
MLFNLNTIDSCFLSSEWRITSTGMFAGSCIGVFLLGMALEFLRRSIKEYDRFLVRQHISNFQGSSTSAARGSSVSSKDGAVATAAVACAVVPPFRPNVWQQGIRAFLHLLAFVVAYILMLVRLPTMPPDNLNEPVLTP